jgi:hypothetical protein
MPSAEQLKKQFLELGILTFVTVVIWIGYSVYVALTQPSQTQVSKKELEKVPLDLNIKLLDSLEKRKGINDKDLSRFAAQFDTKESTSSASLFFFPSDLLKESREASVAASPSAKIEP